MLPVCNLSATPGHLLLFTQPLLPLGTWDVVYTLPGFWVGIEHLSGNWVELSTPLLLGHRWLPVGYWWRQNFTL